MTGGLQGDVQLLKCPSGNPFALGEEAKKDVLGADEAVVEQTGLLLGVDEDPAGTVCEALKDARSFPLLRSLRHSDRWQPPGSRRPTVRYGRPPADVPHLGLTHLDVRGRRPEKQPKPGRHPRLAIW